MSLLTSVSFVERLLPIERESFLWLNHFRSDFLDTFMLTYSDKHTWLPLSIVLLALFLYKVKWKEVLLLIMCGVVIGLLCDLFAAEIIKPFFARLRPTHHPDFRDFVEIVQNRRGGRFGFISNHAANGFGIAAFTSLLFRYRYFTITVYTWVLITAYSRIYLGVHFITDIIGGFIWGTVVGLLVFYLYQLFRKKTFNLSSEELAIPVLSHKKAQLMMLAIFVTVVYILVKALFFQIAE